MQTQEKFSISAGKVREYKDFKVNSTNDVKALENLGIYITPEFTQQAKQIAMDSNFVGGLTTPSITTPVQFLQQWLPGFVEVITRARKIDELVGISTVGSWEDEEIVQGISEHTGYATLYSDKANVNNTSWNVNFERRSVVRFQEGFNVDRLEEARAARINYNSASAKREAVANSLDITRNYIGFYGFNGGVNRTYGFLNDPSLPAYITVSQSPVTLTTQWSTKTALEIISDLTAAFQQLRTRSGDTIDPKSAPLVLAISMSCVDYLSTVTAFGISVADWLQRYNPNITIVSVPEMDEANGNENVFYLYAKEDKQNSSDDGKVFMQMVPAKVFTLGVQQTTKGFREDYSNAVAGILCKRPYAVVRFTGI